MSFTSAICFGPLLDSFDFRTSSIDANVTPSTTNARDKRSLSVGLYGLNSQWSCASYTSSVSGSALGPLLIFFHAFFVIRICCENWNMLELILQLHKHFL